MRLIHRHHPQAVGEHAARELAEARRDCCAKDLFRIGFGLIWAIDAGFKWTPGFTNGFHGLVKEAGEGQPSWLHWWFSFWNEAVSPAPHVWAYAIAVLETLIALALIFGFARKTTYIVTVLLSLGIWSVAEGFGGPYHAPLTDIGAAVIYAVVALGLLALNYEAGPSRFSVDYLLEQRISWWHRIAEVEGRNRVAPRQRRGEAPGATAPPVRPTATPTATTTS